MTIPHKCPFTGDYLCIDRGDPTDCEINHTCLFENEEVREEFEKLPDRYEFNGEKFKNKWQLNSYIRDRIG